VSSPATAAFLTAWRQFPAARCTLARFDLTVPSSLTLRYGTTEVHTPDGNTWQLGLACEPLRHAINYLDPGVSPADATVRLAKRRDASQSSGTIHDMLHQYLFQNATVTIYLWVDEARLGLPVTLAFSDALQVFQGVVSRPAEEDATGVSFYLLQDQSWNKQTPPTVVDKTSYPNSPDVSQGLPIPVIYGAHLSPPMRSPWTSSYGSKSKQEDSGAGLGVVPLILVDAGVGAASVKLVGASHALTKLLDRTNGMSTFLVGESTLDPLDTGGVTETLGASESYLSIADENAIAYAAVIPIDVRATGANTATNPRRAMDVFDETTFASMDQATTTGILQLILPNLSQLGHIESVQALVAYTGNAANANNMRVNAFTPGVGAGGFAPATWAATGTTPVVQTVTWPTNYYDQTWQFGGGATTWDIRVDFVAGAANKASIHWVALVVKYRPQRSVVTPGNQILTVALGGARKVQIPKGPLFGGTVVNVPAVFRLDGQFYSNLKGYADTVGGAFTGSASALIERPPDILNHFLQTYGLVSAGNVETGAGNTGSFVDARDTLRNAQPSDLKLACWIGDRSTVQRVLQAMAQQSGMCVYCDRFTNKWLAFVWKTGATPDYGYTLSWYDLASFSAEETSVVDVRHALRVKYGYDRYKSKTLYEAFVNSGASGQGTNLPTIRDQRLVVDGTNHDLDFNEGGVRHVTLDSATYAPIDLAANAQGKIRALGGAMADHSVGFGFSVKAAYNDTFGVRVAGTPSTITLNAADYTAEGFATELARALNAAAVGLTFACSYSHSTNKFTLSANGNFQVDYTAFATEAVGIFGQPLGSLPAAAATITASIARYGDRFWFLSSTIANYLWASGANQATCCADLLGFPRTDTGFVTTSAATYARGDRERIAATYEGYYGPKEEQPITADWVRDETTAVELRNRIFDLTARPRPQVRFSSFRIPDVRVMSVIDFQSDLDAVVAYPKYGSDGSWVGKPMRVLEVVQNLGPAYHTEVVAIGAE
jgi:hypothetical protein